MSHFFSLSFPVLLSTFSFSLPLSLSVSGFLFIYCLLSTCFWWMSHVSSTFWKVMFPFHARAHENKAKYIHIILLISGIIVPAIPPGAAEIKGSYFVHRYPPLLCVPSNSDILYYGGVLPYSIALCVGITLLIIILHVLHQVCVCHITDIILFQFVLLDPYLNSYYISFSLYYIYSLSFIVLFFFLVSLLMYTRFLYKLYFFSLFLIETKIIQAQNYNIIFSWTQSS